MNKEYKTFEELKEELGDKFEEFMYKANIELLEKVNQLETNRDEAIEILKNFDVFKEFSFPLMKRDEENQVKSSIDYEFKTTLYKQLSSILERGKE